MGKHYCIFEFNLLTKRSKFLYEYGEDFDSADEMCKSMNSFRTLEMPVYFFVRCLDGEEFDGIENYVPFISSISSLVRL